MGARHGADPSQPRRICGQRGGGGLAAIVAAMAQGVMVEAERSWALARSASRRTWMPPASGAPRWYPPAYGGIGQCERVRTARRRWVLVATAAWVTAAVVPLAWVLYNVLADETACERTDSEYGSLSWSLMPPGRVCRYDAVDHLPAATVGPSAWESVYLVGLAVCAAVVGTLWYRSRVAHRGHDDG